MMTTYLFNPNNNRKRREMEELQVDKKELISITSPELSAIEPSKAVQIKAVFDTIADTIQCFEGRYNAIITEADGPITKEITAKAKSLRLEISKVRITTEKTRKAQKEEYLRAGKAIDGVANIVKWAITDKEEALKRIEIYFEQIEKERLEKLQADRVEALSQYLPDAAERCLSTMEDDVWQAYLGAKKKEYEDKIAAEEAARKERVRLEAIEAARCKRIDIIRPYSQFFDYDGPINLGEITEEEFTELLDSLKLKQEAYNAEQARIAKRNAQLEIEAKEAREKAAAVKAAADLKIKKEREAAQEKLKLEREKAAKASKIEADKRAALEADIAKREKEKAEKEAAEKASIQAELSKGDAEKLDDIVCDIVSIKTKYSFKSDRYKKMYSDVNNLLDKVVEHIKSKVSEPIQETLL